MNFTQDAMRFVIQGENALSPVLKQVYKDYDKYTTRLEDANKKLYKTVSKGMEIATTLLDDMDKLPKRAKKAISGLRDAFEEMAPLKVPVALQIKGKKGSKSDTLEGAVSKLLSSASIRLTADMPEKKNNIFDTKNLRKAYKQMIQPPDLKGFIQSLPHFAQGGKVPAPNLPPHLRSGKDGTLAVLSQGEVVKTKTDVQSDLGQLHNLSGRFLKSTNPIYDVVVSLEAANRAAEHWRSLVSANPYDTRAAKMYAKTVQNVADIQKEATREAANLGYTSKVKLVPFLNKSREVMDDYNDSLRERVGGEGKLEKLLKQILSPVRYLALSTALGIVTGKWREFKGAAQDVVENVAGHALDSFVTDLNEANKTLLMSRDDLARFKHELTVEARKSNVSMATMGTMATSLLQAGVRGEDNLKKLTGLGAKIQEATGESADQIAQQIYHSKRLYGETEDQIASLTMAQKKLVRESAVSFDTLSKGVSEFRTTLGTTFGGLNSGQKIAVEKGASTFMATLGDQYAPIGDQLLQEIGKAVQNRDAGSMDMLARQGISFSAAQRAATTGQFGEVVKGLQQRYTQLRGQGQATGAIAEALGLNVRGDQLAGLIQNIDKLGTEYDRLGKISKTSIAGAQSELDDALRKSRTWAKQFETTVSAAASEMGLDTLYNQLKEVNPQMLLAVTYLGKTAAEAGIAGAKLGLELVPAIAKVTVGFGRWLLDLPKVTRAVTTLNTATATSGAASGAGTVGFLEGLSVGFRSFGQVMMSPQGWAAVAGLGAVAGIISGAAVSIGYAHRIATANNYLKASDIPGLFRAIDKIKVTPDQHEHIRDVRVAMDDVVPVFQGLLKVGKSASELTDKGVWFHYLADNSYLTRLEQSLDGVASVVTHINTKIAVIPVGNSAHLQEIGEFIDASKPIFAGLNVIGEAAYDLTDKGWWVHILQDRSYLGRLNAALPEIKDTIETLSKEFQTVRIAAGSEQSLQKAGEVAGAAKPLFEGLDAMGRAAGDLTDNGIWFHYFGDNTLITKLQETLPRAKTTIEMIANQFGSLNVTSDPAQIEKVNASIASSASIFKSLSDAGKDADTLTNKGVMFHYLTDNSYLAKLTDATPKVKTAIDTIVASFSSISIPDSATNRIRSATELFSEMVPLYKNVANIAKLSNTIADHAPQLAVSGKAIGDLIQQLQSNFMFNPDVGKLIKVQIVASDEEKKQVELLTKVVSLLTLMLECQEEGKPMPKGARQFVSVIPSLLQSQPVA